MATASFLDADMATLAGWIRSGFAWWIGELRGLLPTSLHRREAALSAYLLYRGPGQIERVGRGTALPLLVDPQLCLVRQLTLPALGDTDLRRLVQLDSDRILPLPADRLIIGAKADRADRTAVSVAGMPLDTARKMMDEVAAFGFNPAKVGLADRDGSGVAMIDLTPALADAGLMAPISSAAHAWWALAASLFLFNIGLLTWRDVQQVDRLEVLVAGQAPAVAAARGISARIENTSRSARQLANLRQSQDGVATLAAVTQLLPVGAWVQRYGWDGRSIRLSGYKRKGIDIIGALRKSPLLSDVRAANADAIAEVASGQPFDITATIRVP